MTFFKVAIMSSKSTAILRKPDTLRSQVENFLRDAIMSGRFKPGERLIERELCELLDVSRPSLREALRKLEAEKLITTALHRGPVVACITEQEAKELYAVRALLEGFAAHEFTRLADDETVERLGRAVQSLHTAAKKSERVALLEAKSEFYDVILGNCGNELVREMLFSMLSRVNLLRATSFSGPNRLPESLKEIDYLFSRVKARDATGAQQAAHQHILNAEKTALAVLHQQLPSEPLPT
jgi:DNA-binding GntR family transcriptional regulator